MTGVMAQGAIRQLEREDWRGWNELLATLRVRMLRLLRRRGVDEHLAEDLTQEALVIVWSRQSQIRTPDRLNSWATSVVLNRLRSHTRAARDVDQIPADVPFASCGSLDPLVQREARSWLARRLVSLKPDCRRAVSLRIGLAFPPEKAAQVMGLPRARVRRLLYQGMEGLRATGTAAEGRALARAAGVA